MNCTTYNQSSSEVNSPHLDWDPETLQSEWNYFSIPSPNGRLLNPQCKRFISLCNLFTEGGNLQKLQKANEK